MRKYVLSSIICLYSSRKDNCESVEDKMPLSCRFYANQFPDVEDTVMVNIRQIAEMGAYVSLLEYNNIGIFLIICIVNDKKS